MSTAVFSSPKHLCSKQRANEPLVSYDMHLFATGSNAHGQLNDSGEDLEAFTEVADDAQQILLSTWSTLTWSTTSTVVTRGHQNFSVVLEGGAGFHSAVGDHNGMLGLLRDGKLWVVTTRAPSMDVIVEECTAASSPVLLYIAVASNGQTVAVHRAETDEASSKGDMLLSTFASFEAMRTWYSQTASVSSRPQSQYGIEGQPRQLVAGSTSFALLTEDGRVYTWGEARRCSLGRSILGDDGKNDAHEPGLVQALAGVQIRAICHGGWMFGAVSADGAAYIWGLDMPRETNAMGTMGTEDEVVLIELADDGDEEPDVVDMDIGEGHAALVTADGSLYVIGENRSGQLGRGAASGSTSRWVRQEGIKRVVTVMCGPDSTVVLTR